MALTLSWSAVALVAVTAIVPLAACSADETDVEEAVEALLVSFQNEFGFPGATAAFVLQDGSFGGAAIGLADAEAGVPMTSGTRMLAASIGKTVVGALVLDLESEGVLDRGDRISTFLSGESWFARLPNAHQITIGQLLNHTSGLPDHVQMEDFAAQMVQLGSSGSFRPEDAISFILDVQPLFGPGDAWSYTDTGYLVLGLVIEAATGREFYDLVEERFLVPLRLSQTSPSTSPVLDDLAVGYTLEGNPFGLPARTMSVDGALLWNPSVEWTGGGFVSTAHDIARWGHLLFSGSAMDEPYRDRLLDAVQVHPDATGTLYGSGVAVYAETTFGPIYGHGGWIPGYVSSLRHYADHGITVAFQINSDVGVVDDSTDLVSELETALAELLIQPDTTE